MMSDLDFIFKPRSLAVIGASPDPAKWGNWVSRSLIESGYKGDIYLISVKGGVVCGRETYSTISDIESPVDLAVISTPSRFVLEVVGDCVKRGVKGAVIQTAGFAETGEEGKNLEKELLEIVRRGGIRVVGPNCMGIFNSSSNICTVMLSVPKGSFAFFSQSGGMGEELISIIKKRGLGFSTYASCGNQTDILFHEYLDYVKDDPDTKVILLYVEGVKEGREFLRIAKETTRNKPVVALKGGTSSAGIRSAASHTASLAGSNEVYDAAFKQAGIIRVNSLDELVSVAEALVKCPLPRGNRMAILSDGGGLAIIAADAAEKYNLEVSPFSKETQEKLSQILLPIASKNNPIDNAADTDPWNYFKCVEVLLQDKDVDGLLCVGEYLCFYDYLIGPEFSSKAQEVSDRISQLVKEYNKPIIFQVRHPWGKIKAVDTLIEQGIPVYDSSEKAARAMSALVEYREYLDRCKDKEEKPVNLSPDRVSKVKAIIGEVKKAGRVNLVETEAREILKAYSLPMSDFKLARDKDEAIKIAKEIGYPVAMKIVSPDIIHKSDAGGVKLSIKNKDDVEKAFVEITDNARNYNKEAEIYGLLITPMENKGTEVIVGMTKDQTFGPTIMFGLGGIFVEVLKDVSFRVAPLTKKDAHDMISQIKGFPILKGVRGYKPADIDAIADIIMKVAMLITENPEISEMDLNPVFAFEDGASVVDTRIILSIGN